MWALLPLMKKSSQHQKSLLWDWTLKQLLAAGDGFFLSIRAARPFFSPGSFGGSKCIRAWSQQSDRDRLHMPECKSIRHGFPQGS